jgi:hypothetical protein
VNRISIDGTENEFQNLSQVKDDLETEFIIDYLNQFGDGVFEVCKDCFESAHEDIASRFSGKQMLAECSSKDNQSTANSRRRL